MALFGDYNVNECLFMAEENFHLIRFEDLDPSDLYGNTHEAWHTPHWIHTLKNLHTMSGSEKYIKNIHVYAEIIFAFVVFVL